MRIRLRRFVGEHPVLMVNLATVVACLGVMALFLAIEWLLPYSWIRAVGRLPFLLSVFGIPTLFLLVAVMMIAFVLGRAGLTSANILGGMKYVPLWVAAMLVLMAVADAVYNYIAYGIPWSPERADVPALLIAWTMVSLLVMVQHALGWGAAALVIRYKTRHGKWETTRPVTAEPTTSRSSGWVTGRPGAALALMTVATTGAVTVSLWLDRGLIDTMRFMWLGRIQPYEVILYLALPYAACFATGVGLVLGRAGRTPGRMMGALAWSPILLAVLLVALWICGPLVHGRSSPTLWRLGIIWLRIALSQTIGHIIGWGFAALIRRWQVHRGRWPGDEAVVPDDAAAEQKGAR